MADNIDQAQQAQDDYLQASLGRVQAENNRQGPSLLYCLDCGEEIPKARREAVPGCQLCVKCKEKETG